MDDKITNQADRSLNQPRILQLLQAILALHETEIDGTLVDCGTCGDQLDCLAELIAAGQNPHQILPAICEHLRCCRDCNEEFQALLLVVMAEQTGKL